MAADLRALAERLALLQPCEVCEAIGAYPIRCPACDNIGRRLPTEAEVRAAIFEEGYRWLNIDICQNSADVRAGDSQGQLAYAEAGEATADSLVLLALLRALEEVRRG